MDEEKQPLLVDPNVPHSDLTAQSPFSSPIFHHSLALLSGTPPRLPPPSFGNRVRRRRKSSQQQQSTHHRRHSFDSKAQLATNGEDHALHVNLIQDDDDLHDSTYGRSHSARSPSDSPEFNEAIVGLQPNVAKQHASPGNKILNYILKRAESPIAIPRKLPSLRSINGETDDAVLVDSSSDENALLRSESAEFEYSLNDDAHVVIKKGSSFTQTVFNTTNVIVGIGILGFPFAFRNAGWVGGSILICFIMAATCYSAQLLGRCLNLRYPQLQSFSDIGREAFGIKMEYFIGFIFFVELFLACSAYIILCGDNLEKLFPEHLTKGQWMIFVTAVMLPSTWLTDLAMLSYLSVFGIFASAFLLLAVVYTGFVQPATPGSLLHPAPTISFDLNSAPIALGLIMVSAFHCF
jgi:hypothetical protein